MARKNVLPIDPMKFELAILKKFDSKHDFARASGHSSSYATDCIRLKRITKATLVFLESKGINYDDICPDPEPEVVEEPAIKEEDIKEETNDEVLNENITISVNDLSEVVAVAIYTAFVNLHKDGII